MRLLVIYQGNQMVDTNDHFNNKPDDFLQNIIK